MTHTNALRAQNAAAGALRRKFVQMDDALLDLMDRERRLGQLDAVTTDQDDAALADRYGMDEVG